MKVSSSAVVLGIEGIEIVESNHARQAVPFVGARILIIRANIGLGLIVLAEKLDIRLRIIIAGGGVWEESQGLVIAHRPGNLLVDVRGDKLSSPVAMVAANETHHGNIV